jgi:hypothetical protein
MFDRGQSEVDRVSYQWIERDSVSSLGDLRLDSGTMARHGTPSQKRAAGVAFLHDCAYSGALQ